MLAIGKYITVINITTFDDGGLHGSSSKIIIVMTFKNRKLFTTEDIFQRVDIRLIAN